MSYNAFLINTGTQLILIDTGTGGKLDDEPEFHGAGHLLANLEAAGYRPDQVDEIFITHRGQDHIGGLTTGTERTFPNATVVVPRIEFEKFLDPTKAAALIARAHDSKAVSDFVEFTRKLFEPYIRVGKFKTFDEDTTLSPGVRAIATHGHTPGHTCYIIESKEQTLLLMGDLVLMGALQFEDPSLGSYFDADPEAAAGQRKRIFELASSKQLWVAGSHLSFPAIGHIRAEGDHYVWVPINYALPR
jgi:glyoxylase-like metal-dependent hydrolase (beta-lactamase superfamily II)